MKTAPIGLGLSFFVKKALGGDLMHTPVFFSVGKEKDTHYATKVHKELGEQLAYHYKVTGAEVIEFRKEIESKLTECSILVVFWSNDYVASEAACLELAFFKKLAEASDSHPKKIIVVPQDSLDIQSKWKNPINQKDEFALGKWRNDRAIEIGADANRVARLILRTLEELRVINNVLIPRGWLVDNFKSEISLEGYDRRELIFVTGQEGHGRRTALSQYMDQTHPHRIARKLHLDSIEGPRDLLIRLLEVSFATPAEREEIFKNIRGDVNENIVITKEIRKILHQARDNKSYYVISIDKFTGIDSVKIPIWLSETMNVFGVGKAPLVFVVTSSPANQSLLDHYPNAGRVLVPGLEEAEMKELVHLLSLEDPIPTRWTTDDKNSVATSSGSNPAMCKSIMRSLATEPNLDFIKEVANRVEASFRQALSALMAHWTKYYAENKSALVALRIVERLGVANKNALDEILLPVVDKHGPIDLYTMRDQGLIEQLSDGIYRIPPLIQRLLGNALWGKVSAQEIDRLFLGFSKKSILDKSAYGAIYASNKVAAAIRSGAENLLPELDEYITISMLFRAGLEKYSGKQWQQAHSILQRALKSMLKHEKAVDVNTMIEIARYSGLAAARMAQRAAVAEVCVFLETKFAGSKRDRPARAMAEFVKGFELRLRKNYINALQHFQSALNLLDQTRNTERQRAAVYTEMATCYLRKAPPDFGAALEMAKSAFKEKDVTHTLNAYVHALVLFTFRSGKMRSQAAATAEIASIEGLISQLEVRSKETMQTFHVDRLSEYLRERRLWELTLSNAKPSAVDGPIEIDLEYV